MPLSNDAEAATHLQKEVIQGCRPLLDFPGPAHDLAVRRTGRAIAVDLADPLPARSRTAPPGSITPRFSPLGARTVPDQSTRRAMRLGRPSVQIGTGNC